MNETKGGATAFDRMPTVIVAVALLSAIPLVSEGRAQQGDGGSLESGAMAVEVVKPQRRTVVRKLKMPATLLADEQVDLFAKVSGYVELIDVDIGSRVRNSDVLVKLSVPEMADELRQAQAVLAAKETAVRAFEAKALQAQRMVETAGAHVKRYEAQHELDQINLDRKQELRDGGAIPAQALDEARIAHTIAEAELEIARADVAGAQAEKEAAEADVEVARSEIAVARARLSRLQTLTNYATIRAPFDGVITVRFVDHGTFVRSAAEGAASPLLQVAKTNRIRVALDVPEVDAPYVHEGTGALIDIKALKVDPFPATVSRIAKALRPDTRTMRAEIDIDNAAGRLAPGMYAQVVIKLESRAQAMVIPSKALRLQGKDTVVLVSADGVARRRPVTTGYDDGIWVEILSGLREEDLVITSTGGALVAGVAVSPVLADS